MPCKSTAEVQCSTCYSVYTVDRDEDGGAAIDLAKCAHPECETLLCAGGCDHLSFKCSSCDQRFCLEHAIEEKESESECTCIRTDVDRYDDSWCFEHNPSLRPKPLLFCPACIQAIEHEDWPEIQKIEPITAVVMVPDFGNEVAG